MIRISHKRKECIGCAACVEAAPDFWKMDDDGLASLLAVKNKHATLEFGEAYEDDRAQLEDSAENCPVDIIKID